MSQGRNRRRRRRGKFALATPASRQSETGAGHRPRRPAPVRSHRRLPTEVASAIDACLEPAPESRPTLARMAAVLGAVAVSPDAR
jgi:hypothetical protein